MTGEAQATRDCLLRVGVLLLAGAAPGPDVERQVVAIGKRWGAPDVRAAATPTGLFVSTTADHLAAFEPVGEPLRFDQMTLLQGVVDRLHAGSLAPADAITEMAAIDALPLTRPLWVNDLAIIAIAVGICTILQPSWRDLGAAALGSLLVILLVNLSRRSSLLATLLPLLAAFGVTSIVLLYAQWVPLEGTMRTVVSTFAILLPGAMIVTGLSEIASGAAVSGSSRLVSGTVALVLFAVGMFAAVAVRGEGWWVLTNVRADDLGPLGPFVGIVVLGAGMMINVAAKFRDVPWILGVLFGTFVVQYAGQALWGVALGGLLGATVAGASAYLVPRLSGRPLRLVVFLPAFWLLVPGSLGLLGAAEIASGSGDITGVTMAITVMVAIAVGTLIGSSVGRALSR